MATNPPQKSRHARRSLGFHGLRSKNFGLETADPFLAFLGAANAPQFTRCGGVGATGVRLMRALAKMLLTFTLALFALPAFAQQEPPARVGRVSVVEGALAFYGPGDNEWSAARVNFPVAEDGWF